MQSMDAWCVWPGVSKAWWGGQAQGTADAAGGMRPPYGSLIRLFRISF
jgi:hypothetical protein